MGTNNAVIQEIQAAMEKAKVERSHKLDEAHTRGHSLAKFISEEIQPVSDWLNTINFTTTISHDPGKASFIMSIRWLDGLVFYKFYIKNEEACHYFECTVDGMLKTVVGLEAFCKKIDYSKSHLDYTGKIIDGIKKITVYAAKAGHI